MNLLTLSSLWYSVLGTSSSSRHLLSTSGILHPFPVKRPQLRDGVVGLALGTLVYAPWILPCIYRRKIRTRLRGEGEKEQGLPHI